MFSESTPQKIAVIGGGISGNLVARLLHSRHDVTLFEAGDYLGGHANTVDFELDGKTYSVDTGFMVFNDRTYPNFCRLLEILGIAPQESDMSFSVRCDSSGIEYQGSGLEGVFAQRSNLLRPSFLKMIADILRFNKLATRAVLEDRLDQGQTVGQFLEHCHVGRMFREKYLVPMAAAIWSAKPAEILEFPAKFLIGFCHNHGLLVLRDRPQWKTVTGRSRAYVQKLIEPLADRVRLSCPVESVRRLADQVEVRTESGEIGTFDSVVFASHANQTLMMLQDVTAAECEILTAFPYQGNEAVLHTDTSVMPRSKRAWASWNYHIPTGPHDTASVTYDLTRLQRVGSPRPVLLTLNSTHEIDPSQILRTFQYDHPAYNLRSAAMRDRIETIQGVRRAYFCGAYCGYGFHEDGVNSALAVARHFGLGLHDLASSQATGGTGGLPASENREPFLQPAGRTHSYS